LLAGGMGFLNGAVYKWIPKLCKGYPAPVSGVVGCLGAFGGFTFPMLVGAIADTGYKEGEECP